jgi:hypothetical protein
MDGVRRADPRERAAKAGRLPFLAPMDAARLA